MIIDKIYCINMENRTDRKEKMIKLFNKLGGIFDNYQFFKAIKGKDIPTDELNNLLAPNAWYTINIHRNDYKQICSLGAVGCYLSHYNIWKEIIENDYKNVIVFEDDITTNLNYEQIMEYINTLPSDYDYANLSYWYPLGYELKEINDKWSTSKDVNIVWSNAYIISNKGAKKLIKKALPMSLQVDIYVNIISATDPSFKRYFSNIDVFPQEDILIGSDIQDLCVKCIITEVSNKLINESNCYFSIILIILILLIKYL